MIPIKDTVPSRNVPLVTWALIAFNVVVFLFELRLSPAQLERLFDTLGLVPARYTHPAWANWFGLQVDNYWPFLTSIFLHGGWLHLLGNLWTLWIFGDNVEDRLGPWRFLAFYLLAGLAAGGLHVVTNPGSTVPTVGASGAIAGVMGAYFRLYPRARVISLVPVFFYPLFFELPAVTFLGLWFYLQFFSGVLSLTLPGAVGGVAWWAHVGGFLAGALFVGLFARPRRPWQDDEGWIEVAYTRW